MLLLYSFTRCSDRGINNKIFIFCHENTNTQNFTKYLTAIRYVFIIQGEGRGHLTQAISMKQILQNAGHECILAFVGISRFRSLPSFFKLQFEGRLCEFASPNFIRNKSDKSILIFKSFIYNIIHCKQYFNSIYFLNKEIKKQNPDLIISFYEPLTGLYRLFYKRRYPCISVAHEFGWKHTGYICKGSVFDKWAIKLLSRIAAFGSDLLFCINAEDKTIYNTDIQIYIPPLLRKEIRNLTIQNNRHLTVYLLNSGYQSEILNWHQKHPEQEIHCFTDTAVNSTFNSNIRQYRIEDKLFIDSLSSSSGLLTTAGYESVCEAMYLCKPVLMVAVKNHFEQQLNAAYFSRIGAGIESDFFDIDKFLIFTSTYQPLTGYREWVHKADTIILNGISYLMKKMNQDYR